MLMKSRISNEVVLFQNAQIADSNHIFNSGHVDAQLLIILQGMTSQNHKLLLCNIHAMQFKVCDIL